MQKFRVELQEGGIGWLCDLGADMTLQRMVQGYGGGGVFQGLVGLWLLQIVFLLQLQVLVQVEAQAVVKFLESPPAVTSNSSAVFSFTFDNNGSDPCGAGQTCGVQCKVRRFPHFIWFLQILGESVRKLKPRERAAGHPLRFSNITN